MCPLVLLHVIIHGCVFQSRVLWSARHIGEPLDVLERQIVVDEPDDGSFHDHVGVKTQHSQGAVPGSDDAPRAVESWLPNVYLTSIDRRWDLHRRPVLDYQLDRLAVSRLGVVLDGERLARHVQAVAELIDWMILGFQWPGEIDMCTIMRRV